MIGVLTQPDLYEKTVSNMVECKSRGAYLMGLTTFGNYNIDYAELENDKNDLFTCGAYKRFDFGFQGNIGINITNFQIGIGAVQSIIKPTKDIWNLENPKEKSFLLNISYFLNR